MANSHFWRPYPWIVPALQALVSVCSVFVALVYANRLLVLGLRAWARASGRSPRRLYKFEPLIRVAQAAAGDSALFPRVLVQIPMRNEKEVYQRSIAAICSFKWPRDRLVVQVLDDSDGPAIQELIQAECEVWRRKGTNVRYEHRPSREGYKSGNLEYGLEQGYAAECELVVVFDADFEPAPDFLVRSVPFLVHNPDLGCIMSNWEFRNADDSVISKLQEIFYANYFGILNPVGSAFFGFALFLGSGGVWRTKTIRDCGGWRSPVLVEDVDLTLRAALKGWRILYLQELRSKSELAVGYTDFRVQSTRVSNGVTNLLRLRFRDIAKSKVLGWRTKYFILVCVFNMILYEHFAGLILSCVLLPALLLVPEIQVSQIILLAPFFVHVLNVATTTPKHLHLSWAWVLFENVRGVLRATVAASAWTGAKVKWVVTRRVGAARSPGKHKSKLVQDTLNPARLRRLLSMEIVVGSYLVCVSLASWSSGGDHWPWRVYLFLQACTYLLCGLSVHLATT